MHVQSCTHARRRSSHHAPINAADLIALAGAHGVDLTYVAGASSKLDGLARRRHRTPSERRARLDVRDTVEGRESRSYRAPAWSHAELGFAAAGAIPGRANSGMPRMAWLAVQYSLAGHCDAYRELHDALTEKACRLAVRERWLHTVTGIDGRQKWFKESLASLVLDMDAHQWIFAPAPLLAAWYLEVPDEIWQVKLSGYCRSLANEHQRWVAIGRAWIQRRISADEEDLATVEVAG